MARSPYQSEKRRKELARLKKQEEKRERRFNAKKSDSDSPEKDKLSAIPTVKFGIDGLPIEPPAEETAPEGTDSAEPSEKDPGTGPA